MIYHVKFRHNLPNNDVVTDDSFRFVRPLVRLHVAVSLHPYPLLTLRQEPVEHSGTIAMVHYCNEIVISVVCTWSLHYIHTFHIINKVYIVHEVYIIHEVNIIHVVHIIHYTCKVERVLLIIDASVPWDKGEECNCRSLLEIEVH